MVKSAMLADAASIMDDALGLEPQPFAQAAINSLPKGLEFAMRTIAGASKAVSGSATYLLPARTTPPPGRCPVELPEFLRDKDFCEYDGYYHTDVTIPSSHFRPDQIGPDDITPINLDFTYLFRDAIDNPAFRTMGAGRRIRGANSDATKMMKGPGTQEVSIDSQTRLALALRDRRGRRV